LTSAPLPHPRLRLPILGDVLSVDFASPAQGLANQIRKLGVGIMEQRILSLPVVVIADTGLINDVNDEAVWEKNVGFSLRKLRPLAGDGLFTAYNDEPNWQRAHNILMPAFAKSAMVSYHDAMAATMREQVQAWRDHASWIDISAQANRLTTEIIARAGFSYSFGRLGSNDNDPFIDAVQRELGFAIRSTDVIPYYEKLFRQRRKQQHYKDKAYIRRWVADIINSRRLDPSPQNVSILDRMLSNADPASGQRLDDDNIINQMLTLLVAGSETSANTIAFALHHLAANPGILARARSEVDEYWPGRAYPDIAYDDVSKLRYLRRVVDETLRLTPVAPGYYRQAKTATTIGDGRYRFNRGDWVFVALNVAHRDAAWGQDADEFNPDRFLAENLRLLGPRIYKPFGTGPRSCIGRQFALHETILALAAVLHQFDVQPEPGYQLRISETLTYKPAELKLQLTARS
jgi:unspecific monooxygenase